MNHLYSELADIVLAVEQELRRMDCWKDQAPEPERLQSAEPFCIDTLEFTEWLQFVFIVRVKYLIENALDLPAKSDIRPMAEEYFKGRENTAQVLIKLIERFDRLISG